MRRLASLDLNSLRAFAAVAEASGFTAAAEKLGTAKARISLDVSRLERQLKRDLFTRTTRKVVLTDAGRALYEQCVPLLNKIEAAAIQISDDEQPLSGTLRITATVDNACQILATALARFAEIHPALQIDLITSDRQIDLAEEGIDLAIRVGWLRDSTHRAVKLGEFEQYVVAAPAYLERAGTPQTVSDLADHSWIALTRLATPLTWKFTRSASGETKTVRVKAKMRSDTGSSVRALVESGAGISVLDSASSAESLRSGTLQRLLTKWSLPRGGIYAVYPPGRHIAAPARAFVDFYRMRLRSTE